jgi:hypothetical protein
MRLWTLHPKYLDSRGLVALWREGLLAQKVLQGGTRGYTNHPQLLRFRASPAPVAVLAAYLAAVEEEAQRRGYRFDAGKIGAVRYDGVLEETRGQLAYEWEHLQRKLTLRDPQWLEGLTGIVEPEPHPLFRSVAGDVRQWEKVQPR